MPWCDKWCHILILTPCWNHKHGNSRHGGFCCNLTYKNNGITNPESLRTWYPLVARNSCNLPEKHAGKLKDSYKNVATGKKHIIYIYIYSIRTCLLRRLRQVCGITLAGAHRESYDCSAIPSPKPTKAQLRVLPGDGVELTGLSWTATTSNRTLAWKGIFQTTCYKLP